MNLAKAVMVTLLCLLISACYGSRPIGNLNAEPLSWDFIQSVGGIRLGDPYSYNGRRIVPVIVDLSGNQTITVTPTLTNSGLICSGVVVIGRGDRDGDLNMRITIFAEAESEANMSAGKRTGECEGFSLPPRNRLLDRGDYDVYYVDGPDSFSANTQDEHYLGTVR